MAESDSEKRRFPRRPLTLLIQYRGESLEALIAEYAEDVSLGGMFIRTDEPVPQGSIIFVQFTLPDGSSLFEGLAKVAWAREPGNNAPAGMGIEFLNLDQESRAVLKSLVEMHQEPVG
ncbi:MAG: TIGR02266 family protein [Deltaproteobacteria bacterium]|nr:TIGR02266 family protein [Deltaproteobacteria bacterium]